MKKDKLLIGAVLVVIVCLMFTIGTIAYLSASTGKAVTNTFVAAGGGNIIDSVIPDGKNSDYNFNLKESEASLNDTRTGYNLNTTKKVTENTYNDAIPGMVIAKDPKLSVNIANNISAYVFIEVVDTTNENLSYTITTDWVDLNITGNNGGKIYVYKNTPVIGTVAYELQDIQILGNNSVKASSNLVDIDSNSDGMQLGNINFYSYVSQSVGFDDATDAFETCF